MTDDLYATLGAQAIAGGAGDDVRDDPDFERLQAEIGKLSNPSAGGAVDWGSVASLCVGLLSGKGKDMLVAAYLAGACLQQRGLPGLADGLRVLADMMQAYWDTLYPPLKRLRGRRNAVQWLIDRVQAHAAETDWTALPPVDPELLHRIRDSIKAIDGLLRDKDEEAPSLRPLLALVDSVPAKEEAAPAPVPEPAAPVPPPQAAPSPVAAPAATTAPAVPPPARAPAVEPVAFAALNADADLERALDQACARIGEIAGYLLAANLSDARAYRLQRVAAWSAIHAPPPVRDDATLIQPPISQIVDALDRLVASQSDEDIVRFAEAQLAVFPFWLDLNRLCAEALGRMGERYAAARREIASQVQGFVQRVPGIQAMTFAGGKPFADDATKAWIGSLGPAQAGAEDAGGREPDALASSLSKARVLAAEGNLPEAAAALQRLLAQPITPAQKLRVRIQLCELLLTERRHVGLQPFAQAILDEIDRHGLDSWDPPLALAGLKVAYAIAAQDETNPRRGDALLARILALDAAAAVRLIA